MKNIFIYAIIITIFSACSFKTPQDEWKVKSINAFNSYTNNFLKAHENLAKNDLKRAVKHAKSSADLDTLGRIYLSECALNNSVGISDNCHKYVNLQDLLNNKNYDAYKDFILNNFSKDQIKLLPSNYKKFAHNILNNDFKKANKDVRDMKSITSKLLAASILKKYIDIKTINEIIKNTSFYGYKKAVIYWLKELKSKSVSDIEKSHINKKILILENSF